MKIRFITVLAAALLLCSCGSKLKNVTQEDKVHFTCEHEGRKRVFIYISPENVGPETSLLVVLHGAAQSADGFKDEIAFEEEALKRNYAVLYLQGDVNPEDKTSALGWVNTYTKPGKQDLNFVVDAVQFIRKQYNIGNKCYVAGFSQGGFLTSKLAVDCSDKFNAFASVAGMMPEHVWEHKKNKKAAFFQINGLKDELIPMDLNKSSQYNPNPSMEKMLAYFSKTNKLGTDYTQEQINDKVTLLKNENKVWWMLISDYHHGWPKNDRANINVNEYILDFFDKN